MRHSFIPKGQFLRECILILTQPLRHNRSYIQLKVGDDSVEINAQHKIRIAHEASKLGGSAPERITLPNVFCVSDFDHQCLKRRAREPSDAGSSGTENGP